MEPDDLRNEHGQPHDLEVWLRAKYAIAAARHASMSPEQRAAASPLMFEPEGIEHCRHWKPRPWLPDPTPTDDPQP